MIVKGPEAVLIVCFSVDMQDSTKVVDKVDRIEQNVSVIDFGESTFLYRFTLEIKTTIRNNEQSS